LIVLPELTENVAEISKYLNDNFAVTSIRENDAHIGVLIDKNGIIFRQKQLHKSNQHSWINDFGDQLETFDLPFGRLAIIVGEDSLYPETFRLAAYQNVEIAAIAFNARNSWETEFGLLERSVENRLSIAAATRPNKNLGDYGNSLIATISNDFTLWTEWKTRPFDGNINYPIIKRGDNFDAEIYPANAENRFVSKGTDVVDGRAYWLLGDLVKGS
jgi:deaminated glutathione amidase